MPIVKVGRRIQAPVSVVYSLAKDVERFPEIMPDVESVEVLSREGNRTVTRWVGIIRQFNRKLKWEERDEWNDDDRTCVFEQTEGDFTVYQGSWRFAEEDGATAAELAIEFELHVPLVGSLIRSVVAKLMKANCEGMLAALATAAEGTA